MEYILFIIFALAVVDVWNYKAGKELKEDKKRQERIERRKKFEKGPWNERH